MNSLDSIYKLFTVSEALGSISKLVDPFQDLRGLIPQSYEERLNPLKSIENVFANAFPNRELTNSLRGITGGVSEDVFSKTRNWLNDSNFAKISENARRSLGISSLVAPNTFNDSNSAIQEVLKLGRINDGFARFAATLGNNVFSSALIDSIVDRTNNFDIDWESPDEEELELWFSEIIEDILASVKEITPDLILAYDYTKKIIKYLVLVLIIPTLFQYYFGGLLKQKDNVARKSDEAPDSTCTYHPNKSDLQRNRIISIMVNDLDRHLQRNILATKIEDNCKCTYFIIKRDTIVKASPKGRSPKISTVMKNSKVRLLRERGKKVLVRYLDDERAEERSGWIQKKYGMRFHVDWSAFKSIQDEQEEE